MIFDSHAHYDDEQFDNDRESLLGSLLPSKGVSGVINCSSTLESIEKTLNLTKKHSYFYGAVGIHPECAANLPSDYLQLIEKAAQNEKIVAIGEIGLDYHWLDSCPKETQTQVFKSQLELAKKLNLPVILHDREAHGDTMDIVRQYKPRGVLHCFSGSKEMALDALRLGISIGIGGVLTFKNARHIVEVAEAVPMDKIILETDCPYLSPVPHRGKRNDSSLIPLTAERLGEIKGISAEEVLRVSGENIKRIFSIA